MDKVSPTFDFEAWRDAGSTNESGKSDAGIKIVLGGMIVQVTNDSKGIVIVAQQMPIVSHPAYGPMEDLNRIGEHEFAFLYEREIEPLDLMRGNRFLIVGTTTSRRPVLVRGIPKTEPFIIADCIHVWYGRQLGLKSPNLRKMLGQAIHPFRKRHIAPPRTKGMEQTIRSAYFWSSWGRRGVGRTRQPMTGKNVWRLCKVYGRMIGAPMLKPHDLRHGVAMEVYEQHHDLEEAMCASKRRNSMRGFGHHS